MQYGRVLSPFDIQNISDISDCFWFTHAHKQQNWVHSCGRVNWYSAPLIQTFKLRYLKEMIIKNQTNKQTNEERISALKKKQKKQNIFLRNRFAVTLKKKKKKNGRKMIPKCALKLRNH